MVAYVTVVPGAEVTEDDLLSWAADRVPEHAAAPKAVTMLDALPVTAVGKPYKFGLRADATRRAITDALAAIPGAEIDTRIEDGSVVTTVTIPAALDEAAIKTALSAYAVRWHLRLHNSEDVS